MISRKIIDKFFIDQDTVSRYVDARLRGDYETAPPPVAASHDEPPADLLCALYLEPGFSIQQKQWLWQAVKLTAYQAWKKNAPDLFSQVIVLANRIAPPKDAASWNEFLPQSPRDCHWDKPDHRAIGALALRLIKRWKLQTNPAFWQQQVDALIPLLAHGTSAQAPLLQALEGLQSLGDEPLDRTIWDHLLPAAISAKQFPQSLLRQALDAQWLVCEKNNNREQHDNCEQRVFSQIRSVFAAALVNSSAVAKREKELRILFDSWLKLPWQTNTTSIQTYFDNGLKRSTVSKPRNPRRYATTEQSSSMVAWQ